jgi:hypothetical protein
MDAKDVLDSIAAELDRHVATIGRIQTDPYAGASIQALNLGTQAQAATAAMQTAAAQLRGIANALTQ